MKQSMNSTEKGFTIVENMLAVAVLAISVLALGQLMSVAVRQNAFTRVETMSNAIAQEKLETLRAAYNKELETETASDDLTAGSHGPQMMTMEAPTESSMGDSDFQVSWTVTIAGTRKTVDVTVEPQDSNELNSDLHLTTIFVP
ncbi:MAG: prepilin-type N-terminal cleavage/methylation domain-containing protein [Acidobacteria bacterium]|nr:prepilin-type N-terminal cleavage/methylation domain-containing protein [Acidobacteriota bacterium]